MRSTLNSIRRHPALRGTGHHHGPQTRTKTILALVAALATMTIAVLLYIALGHIADSAGDGARNPTVEVNLRAVQQAVLVTIGMSSCMVLLLVLSRARKRHAQAPTTSDAILSATTDQPCRKLPTQPYRRAAALPVGDRAALMARLSAHMPHVAGRQGLLIIDIDDFAGINNVFGNSGGDHVLSVVSERLAAAVRDGDLVARFGGDEFAVLLDNIHNEQAAVDAARRLARTLAEPIGLAGGVLRLTASIGVACRYRADLSSDEVIRRADIAMKASKNGSDGIECFDVATYGAERERLALKADLSWAVRREELILNYQPVADLHTGQLVGVEALVRWQHPIRGVVPPIAFIPLAEETGGIEEIGTWVLTTACRQLAAWQEALDRPDLWLSANVSARQLRNPALVELVSSTIRAAGLDPRTVVLEVTETALMENSSREAATLAGLKKLGVRLAIDDFGTGYSSLAHISRLPVDALKIDRSFVSGDDSGGAEGAAVVEAVTGLGQRLGLDVVPEGIENEDQLHQLRDIGCRLGQGYLLCPPISGGAITELLRNRQLLLPQHLIARGDPQSQAAAQADGLDQATSDLRPGATSGIQSRQTPEPVWA